MARRIINKKKHYCTGFDSMRYGAWGWQRENNFLRCYNSNSASCILYKNNRRSVLNKNWVDAAQDWTAYGAMHTDKI
jgi:hypothetical protein